MKINFKNNSEITTLPSQIDYVAISFKNNGMFDEKSVYRPIIKKTDNGSEKVIGVITEVDKKLVAGYIYADIFPEINNGYVCSVEIKER